MDNKNEYILKANLNKDYLKKIVYWTICKYKMDKFTREQSSSKQSLIGGFIDRWMNRAPEFLIFNELLKEKEYDVVIDNYFYTDNIAKNAPDIIGLINADNNQHPFVTFNDNTWKIVDNMPFIEMKTFRKEQSLITIPCNQFEDNHYYAIVESHLNEDYLLNLFDQKLFDNEEYYNFIIEHNESDFILSNKYNIIEKPEKLKISDDLGYYLLIGIYKGKDLKKYGITIEKGDFPLYFDQEIDPPKPQDRFAVTPPKKLDKGLHTFEDDEKNIPFYIDMDNDSEIIITHKTKMTYNVKVKGFVTINGIKISEGLRRLEFKGFEKSGKIKEYLTTKSLIKYFNPKISLTNKLIQEFDVIIKNKGNE